MSQKMDDSKRFSQVALIARARALTATPPAPSIGDSLFDPPLPEWIFAVAPMGADVLYTNQSVLPLTSAGWSTVEPPSRMETKEDRDGQIAMYRGPHRMPINRGAFRRRLRGAASACGRNASPRRGVEPMLSAWPCKISASELEGSGAARLPWPRPRSGSRVP